MKQPRIAIIGAGMSGICAAAKLRMAGVSDVVVYEKADRIGGTWRENTYPGLSCDVPSRYYSYTFAPNPDWTRLFSPGGEIHAYLDRVVDDLGLRPLIRFGSEVDEGVWNEADHRWEITTTAGDTDAYDFIVSAAGVLHHPRTPEIKGLEDFAGATFHSARWDHTVPLDGKKVAVVGTGSTGVQITKALAPRCDLKLFQRTPQWVLPLGNPAYRASTRRLLRSSQEVNRVWGRLTYRFYQRLFEGVFCQAVIKSGWQRRVIDKVCRLNLRLVRDPALRERLTPGDQPMCKRMIIASGFYKAVQNHDVGIVDEAIDHVTERGIVTRDGVEHELDVIALATGFHAHTYLQPVELVGPGGVRLSDVWRDEPRGYRTVALQGFPNFFLLLGPHSPIGNQSLFMITETQVDYVLQWVDAWRRGEFGAATPRPEAAEAFNEELRGSYGDTIWMSGCDSWYLGKDGLPSLWPWSPQAHRDMLAAPRPEEWTLEPAVTRPLASAGSPA